MALLAYIWSFVQELEEVKLMASELYTRVCLTKGSPSSHPYLEQHRHFPVRNLACLASILCLPLRRSTNVPEREQARGHHGVRLPLSCLLLTPLHGLYSFWSHSLQPWLHLNHLHCDLHWLQGTVHRCGHAQRVLVFPEEVPTEDKGEKR